MIDGAERNPSVRLLSGSFVTVLAALAWAGVGVFQRRDPPPVLSIVVAWSIVVAALVIAALACRWTGRTAELEPSGRKLWSRLQVTLLIFALGMAANAVEDGLAPDRGRPGPTSMVIYVAGTLYVVWTLLSLPMDARPRREVLALALEIGSVVVAGALYPLYLLMRQLLYADQADPFSAIAVAVALELVAVVVIVKVTVAGSRLVDRGALILLALALLAGIATGVVLSLIGVGEYVSSGQVAAPIGCLFFVLAADRQLSAGRTPGRKKRRSYSLVPYVAVAVTDALLLAVVSASVGLGSPVGVVVLGVVLVTGLICGRQIAALAEIRRFRDQLSHQATHDGLTRLPNRALFLERAGRALGAAGAVTIVLVDLDDFKTVNDRLGPDTGDELLVTVAGRLRRLAPAGQLVARLGGDEFAVLLTGFPAAEADAFAGLLVDALAAPLPAGGQDLLVQASIGLAGGRPADDGAELLRRADVAMYAAKEAGKGRFARYDDAMDQRSLEQARLGAQLRRALDNGELHLVYQPIVRLPDGRLTGVETLVRWSTPAGDELSPDVFIPVAERNGLIVELGEWALRAACRQAVRWRDRPGGSPLRSVNVNVSARQLREPGFAALVAEILVDAGLAPAMLVVEVTETAVFDGGPALDELRRLHELGVTIALDDFGTGHSSLGLLRTCPVDVLKVDKSFIEGVTGTTEQAAIATSLIEIAKGLGLRAVAEGVESAVQAATLHALGYQYAQGFHFSGPLPVEQVDQLLCRAELTVRS